MSGLWQHQALKRQTRSKSKSTCRKRLSSHTGAFGVHVYFRDEVSRLLSLDPMHVNKSRAFSLACCMRSDRAATVRWVQIYVS